MAVPRPPIDRRTYDDLVTQAEVLAERYTDGAWKPGDEHELGAALIRIMSGMAEHVVTRLNEVPDRSFLAFLDLIGTQIRPPMPARAALTFQPAAGTLGAVEVPAGSEVAAPAEADRPELIFETDRRLVVTPARLETIFVRDPGADRYAEQAIAPVDAPSTPFAAFAGAEPIPHEIYVACDSLIGLEELEALHFVVTTAADPDLGQLAALLTRWSWWDGETWQHIPDGDVATTRTPQGVEYSIVPPPTPEPVVVAGIERRWLRGRLAQPLPPDDAGRTDLISRSGLRPDRLLAPGGVEHDQDAPFYPFASGERMHTFKIESREVFSRAGAQAEVHFELDPPGVASADLELQWAYPVGANWRILATSSPGGAGGAVDAPTLVDETRALTESGIVRFTVPYDMAHNALLRVHVTQGNYGLGEALAPPRIRRLRLGYADWRIPVVTGVSVEAESTTPPRSPDAAYANQVELDVTKDFHPFGERPGFNDTFYINAVELGRPNNAVTLDFTLSSAGKGSSLALAWEVPVAGGWRAPTVTDGTSAFTSNGKVSVRLPDDVVAATVNGVEGFWLRVRLVGGDYGKPGSVVTGSTTIDGKSVATYAWKQDTFAPPVISKLTIWSTYERKPSHRPLEACVTNNDFAMATPIRDGRVVDGGFAPFTPTVDTRPCLYLGFDRRLGNRPVSLFVDVEPALFEDRILGGALRPADPMQLVWEYADGTLGWSSLDADDETDALSRRGGVRFIGPVGAVPGTQLGTTHWWIRARWDRGEGGIMPVVRRILPNTVWATEGTSVAGEVLGTGTGNPSQRYVTSRAPVLDGEMVEVFEPAAPVAGQSTPEDGGRWVVWTAMPDFHGSAATDRHYVIDRLSGRIVFGDGRRGMVPPIGPAGNIRVSYRTGGGEAGNVPAGAVAELRAAIASIDSVLNVEAAGGGADAESFEQLRERGPRLIRHRSRAVTAQDYEDMAHEASPEVARAAAVLATSGEDSGRIGIVIVPDSSQRRPVPSLELLGQVENHLLAHCDPTVDVWVAGPRWRAVKVAAEVAPVSIDVADQVRVAVLESLFRYVHPLYGGRDGRGFPFDRMPHDSEFYGLIEAIPGVDYVRRLDVAREPGAAEGVVRRPFLVYSGDHRVTVISAGEGG